MEKTNYENLLSNYIKILTTMLPITPHLANECLSQFNISENLSWPKTNNKYLKSKKSNIVIQINGKKRSLISTENDIEEKDLIKIVMELKELRKYTESKDIIKTIFIKNKLINLILK